MRASAGCIPSIFGLAATIPHEVPGQCSRWPVSTVVLQAIGGGAETIQTGLEFGKDVAELELDLDLFDEESDWELRQMGRELQGLIREERELRLAMILAADNFGGAQLDYDAAVQKGFRKLRDLVRMRQRWAGQISEQRYSDMAYRIAETDALQKYRQQFDLAQLYTYLTAAAYDYETNLRGDDPAAGEKFLRRIVAERSLGELRWSTGPWDVEPIVGSGGLAEPLGKMRDNFRVLKGQMGFNNPQVAGQPLLAAPGAVPAARCIGCRAGGRHAQRYYTPNIYADPDGGEAGQEALRHDAGRSPAWSSRSARPSGRG